LIQKETDTSKHADMATELVRPVPYLWIKSILSRPDLNPDIHTYPRGYACLVSVLDLDNVASFRPGYPMQVG
jgi:hypothetical protein